jgi:superfamily II RNA helicase
LEGAKRIDWASQDSYTGSQFSIDTFEYIIVDEIHQMNSQTQGPAMQRLIKRFKCPMLGLSATIGNPEKIKEWIQYLKSTTPNIAVERISYDKRFINQQKHVWNGKKLETIHPLAVVSLDFLQSNKLPSAEMQFVPNDLFKLYSEMTKCYPAEVINSIKPNIFFENACISLNQCKVYETEMKACLTSLSHTYPVQTQQLLDKFKLDPIQLQSLDTKDLYTILKKMQEEKKLPAIVFKFDPTTCKKLAHDLLEYMETEEQLKYPHYREFRELQNSYYTQMQTEIARIDDIDFGNGDSSKSSKFDVKSAKYDRELYIIEKLLLEFQTEFKKK